MLEAEGVRFPNGAADPSRHLDAAALAVLVERSNRPAVAAIGSEQLTRALHAPAMGSNSNRRGVPERAPDSASNHPHRVMIAQPLDVEHGWRY